MAQAPQGRVDESLSEVNVIPLADLSLVLLIILMVLSPMIMQSMIKVHATRASAVRTAEEKPKEPPLILLISPKGTVQLNTVKIESDLELAKRLAQSLGQREDKTVLITADPAAIHGRVVEILDLVKRQGAEKIALLHKAAPRAAPEAEGD
jgi:biopolymer transport protein ExbD